MRMAADVNAGGGWYAMDSGELPIIALPGIPAKPVTPFEPVEVEADAKPAITPAAPVKTVKPAQRARLAPRKRRPRAEEALLIALAGKLSVAMQIHAPELARMKTVMRLCAMADVQALCAHILQAMPK